METRIDVNDIINEIMAESAVSELCGRNKENVPGILGQENEILLRRLVADSFVYIMGKLGGLVDFKVSEVMDEESQYFTAILPDGSNSDTLSIYLRRATAAEAINRIWLSGGCDRAVAKKYEDIAEVNCMFIINAVQTSRWRIREFF
ncbi:MAG: hypothetical protein K2M79_02960 [Muribaculaceae bacterium]|nr:hypothetical protein [Muribaculaceae bacterium]